MIMGPDRTRKGIGNHNGGRKSSNERLKRAGFRERKRRQPKVNEGSILEIRSGAEVEIGKKLNGKGDMTLVEPTEPEKARR